ncbi:MAG: response regulator [Pseudanabaena frigida]|uniref:Response regulator n=1 Tax=Pseudanabaena frigida TaxID=945775 RepID=A0A2W4WA25_9CYAN|nr:MAG: response regulator [Pseudanabaena frigida]
MSYNPSIELTGNILLVDDLPENLQLLSDLLLTLGYSVRSVTNGRMALKTAKIKRPDVIILDIKMPDMDGYQVCQAFKADEELRDIPIIFISALDDVFDKVKAFWSGGVDYISKPFQSEEVLVRLENQLAIQRHKRSLQDEIARRKETEEMLYQSRALVTSVLNSVSDGIAALQAVRDPNTGSIEDFRCLVVNPVIARIFDRNREDLIGKLVLRRFLERFSPVLFEQLINVVETGITLNTEICYPSDPISWYQIIVVKLGDGFTVTLRDITSSKQVN